MASFAELNINNIVLRVIAIDDQQTMTPEGIMQESVGIAFCRSLYGTDTAWAQTYPEGFPRQNYAGIGYRYDPIAQVFLPPVPTWDDIRAERDRRMLVCDWTQLPDAVLTFTEKGAWADYRQALRDVPQTYPTPDAVIWPEVPA